MARFLISMFTLALGCGRPSELTDAQVQEAIERGRHTRLFSMMATTGGWVDLVGMASSVWIKSTNNPLAAVHGEQEILVLSDLERIAVAASAIFKTRLSRISGACCVSSDVAFSVEDARASAIRLGVVTVVLKTIVRARAGRASAQLANWSGPSVHMVLKADDKIISTMTNAQYFSGWPSSEPASAMKVWNLSDYAAPTCQQGTGCAVVLFVFPVLEETKKLTVILLGGDGTRIEKEVEPALFESHLLPHQRE